MLQHLDGLVATDLQSFQEMQRLEGIGWKVIGFNGMHPERLKEVLENDERKPAFVQNQLTIYEPGGPDDSRNFDSQMEALQKLDIPMVALGLSDENHSCGYLEPLEDPHLLAMAHRRGVSPKQLVDRWWLQLGGLLFVEGHIEEHLGVFDFSLPEDEMRLLNGLSSLVASSPGRRAPAKKDRPIVMASLGDTAEFGYKMQASDPESSVHLESGDVIVFGGSARDLVHAMLRVFPDTGPTALQWDDALCCHGGHRVSLTWRDVGVEDGLTFNSDERLGLTVSENTLPRYLPRSKGAAKGRSQGGGYHGYRK
eukprot:symbB.v1.2.007882.t1/scaffold482.1/size381469/10